MNTFTPRSSAARRFGQARLRLPNPMIGVVWLAIFVPGHLFDWWIERIFAASVAVLAAFTLFAQPPAWPSSRPAKQIVMFIGSIQLLYLASFVHAIAFMGLETGPRDYFEIGRYLIIGTFILYALRHYDERVRRSTEVAIVASLYYSILVGVCYLRYVPVLTEFFRYQLYAQTKTAINFLGQLRLAAPFENPNFLGFFATQILAYEIFFSDSPLRVLHSVAAITVVYFSGSRTAWVATALVLGAAAATYSYISLRRLRLRLLLYVLAGAFALVGTCVRYSEQILHNYRVTVILDAIRKGGIQRESNAAGRIEQTAASLEFLKQSPILGWGPSKYATWDYIDNQYAYWALRNGWLGAAVILLAVIVTAVRFVLTQEYDPVRFYGAVTLVGAISVALITCEFLNNFRLFFLTWFIGMAVVRKGRE